MLQNIIILIIILQNLLTLLIVISIPHSKFIFVFLFYLFLSISFFFLFRSHQITDSRGVGLSQMLPLGLKMADKILFFIFSSLQFSRFLLFPSLIGLSLSTSFTLGCLCLAPFPLLSYIFLSLFVLFFFILFPSIPL